MSKGALIIGKPTLENCDNGNCRLCCDLNFNQKKVYTVWYEFDGGLRDYICVEVIDGILVNLLLYAMEHDYDIESEEAVSDDLYLNLTSYLIPAISKNVPKYHKIAIYAPTVNIKFPSKNAVGASLSGGVDSFYTLLKHCDQAEKEFNITHLTFFNAGASGAMGGKEARERYHQRIDWIRNVADEMQMKLVCVDTNINEFLRQAHEPTNTFRTLAIPLLLQKLFSKYYFASSYEFDQFKFLETDTSFYDILNMSCLSTKNLRFYLDGAEASRSKKLQFISNYPITYDKLNVCVADAHNCGKCDKCRRTMLGLYGLHKLDLYKNTFDVDYFKAHKHEYFKVMLALRKWKAVPVRQEWEEIYQLVKREVTVSDRISGYLTLAYRVLRRKIYRTDFGKKIYERYFKK